MKIRHMAIAVAILGLMGCSEKEQTVEERGGQRWQHLVDMEPKEAYAYLTPGYRKTESETAYIGRISAVRLDWTDVAFNSKQCEEENVCSVIFDVTYKYKQAGVMAEEIETTTALKETWLRKDGVWYHLPKSTN